MVPGAAAAASEAMAGTFAERAGYSQNGISEVAGAVPATGTQEIEITFVPTNPTLYDVPDAGAPPMTAAQVGDVYGLSTAAYSSAEHYFELEGLVVSHAWPDRLSLSLTGSAAAIERAFDTSLLTGNYEGRTVTFPGMPPSLPAGLEAEVQSVAGLSTGFDTFSIPETSAPAVGSVGNGPAVNPNDLVTPSIARDIYDVSGLYNLTSAPTYATGEGIVLLLWGWGYSPSDIQTFYSQDYPAGFPAPNVVPYPVDGAPAPSANAVNDPSGGSREMTLDLEWSGSMAPGATLDAVYAPPGPASGNYSPTDPTMIDALNLATNGIPGVAAISMSFGSTDGADSTLTSGFENDFAVAAKEDISLFAATGDTGGDAAPGCSGGLNPEYPSASPQVVAVGGTTVSLDRGPLGAVTGFSESAWADSGGGFSAQFSAPSWQEVGSARAPIEANGHRGMPDVAASADYNYLYFGGQPGAGAGTSFSTPLWAGMIVEMDALHGSNLGFLTPRLYQLGAEALTVNAPFHDITTSGNCLGSAGPGWDTATGWGSPAGVLLYEHLVASFVNLTISASPSPVAPGGTVTIVVTVLNATSSAPISGIPVVVTIASTGLVGGPCSGTFGSVVPVTNGSGEVVASISVPLCYLGSGAAASILVANHGYYGTGSASVSVNLLGFDPALAYLSTYPSNVALFAVIMAVAITAGGLLGRQRRGPASAMPVAALVAPAAPSPPSSSNIPAPPTPPTEPPASSGPAPPAP